MGWWDGGGSVEIFGLGGGGGGGGIGLENGRN